MLSVLQKSLRPAAVMDRSAATMAGVDVRNPKAPSGVLRTLYGFRLQTQNAAAHEIISPTVVGREPNAFGAKCLA
jgi:hypothetical protein